ncbi:MAG: hypothetical protein A2Y21_09095 [Clostridiales bacterium GWC2_40_7]|nr:MAG: hypothetical protein A2Y21_09095 [Clostridiales bacterium GWC2_40_7]
MKRSLNNLMLIILIIAWFWSPPAIAVDLGTNGFKDTATHWAKDYISYLTDNGAIKGFTDGTFKPDNKITRAEFTAILLRALKNDVGQPEVGKWYANYITEATDCKYILSGEFDSVERNITRGEMARMIVRTMDETYPENMADYASQLSDYNKMPAEYKDFALKAYVKGIITGQPGGVFAYAELASRAEATTMIVRLIDGGKRARPSEPVSSDIYIKEAVTGQEAKVTTSHPEIIPHIIKGMEILSGEGYTEPLYSKENNHVQFYLYKDKDETEKPIWEKKAILSYHIYTEKDPREDDYLPFALIVHDTQNSIAYEKCKKLIKDIFPEAYDKIVKELDSKSKDTNYNNKVWEKVNGREIRISTFQGSKQINIFIAPEIID